MKAKKWLVIWLAIVLPAFIAAGLCVYHADPYFHYHKPFTEKYYYVLNNERSQNDGIIKRFEYDAMISGTSMTANFKTSEMDALFGCSSIKATYLGGTYKEINDAISLALSSNPKLKTVVRCLDTYSFMDPPDRMRTDLGRFPTYLYDSDPFNDVEYLLNWDVFYRSTDLIIEQLWPGGRRPGITSFDDYMAYQDDVIFGKNSVCPEKLFVTRPEKYEHLSASEKTLIEENVTRNITDLAVNYPDVDFCYFFSPYSIIQWLSYFENGSICKYVESEKLVTELILQHENIRLFSFNTRFDIITDLNNYYDPTHYAAWLNSLILKWMHDGDYQLTKENYEKYLEEEFDYYHNFDYESLNDQEDYEADYYAAALLNCELTGAKPVDLICSGAIEMTETGMMADIDLETGYNYLVFYAKKNYDRDTPPAFVYDGNGLFIDDLLKEQFQADGTVHMYAIDLSSLKSTVRIVFNGFLDESVDGDSVYSFYGISLY